MKNKIICITPIEHIGGLKKKIERKGKIIYEPYINKKNLFKLINNNKSINCIFCNPNKQSFILDKKLLKNSGIKLINTASTGTNHINLSDCKSLGIKIFSLKKDTKLINTLPSTSELAFCLMISLLKNLVNSHNSVKIKKEWDYEKYMGQELCSLTIGILGFGRLGKFMAKFCDAFGMRVLIHDKYKNSKKFENVSLNDLAKKSDIISLHVHLESQTKNMINTSFLKKCKKNPIIINTSRGEIVNENDILEHLKKNIISGYGADVLTDELNNIKKSKIIKNMNKLNILITPHIGGMTWQGQKKAFEWAVNKF